MNNSKNEFLFIIFFYVVFMCKIKNLDFPLKFERNSIYFLDIFFMNNNFKKS